MSCHPSHTKPDPTDQEQQIIEERQRIERAQDKPDPRKIQRQHRWKLGHDPIDQDDHDNPDIAYLDIEYTGEPLEPNQLDQLEGGPDSGVPCLTSERGK